MSADDPIAPLRAWLRDWQAAVRAVDFEAGRKMCAPEIVAFGTVAPFVEGIDNVMAAQWHKVWGNIREFTMHDDRARGAIAGDHAWVATTWDSLGVRPDGSTFRRPGRATIAFVRRDGRWLAAHTHFTLIPSQDGGPDMAPKPPTLEPPRQSRGGSR
jgi:ketosteroid isomerase-like protein